jgi:LPXTG-motif cell wall-anchored protein
MINAWVIAGLVAFLAAGVGVWSRRRRRDGGLEINSEPVSGQWLAEARARGEEHGW